MTPELATFPGETLIYLVTAQTFLPFFFRLRLLSATGSYKPGQ